LLETGDVAFADLCLFVITDPRVSRYWQVHTTVFDNRPFVDLLPPSLITKVSTSDDDERNGLEQDEAYFAALDSDEFKQICLLLEGEYRAGGA
jgi:hypothetical protein